MQPPNIAKSIRAHVLRIPLGVPFTSTSLLAHGPRASVDQALSRLVKAGTVQRVARGVFVRPETSAYVSGPVMPEATKIAQAVAKTTNATIQVHGSEAARRLGLTTQVPMQQLFLTSGPSRRLQVGSLEVRLKHVAARKLALAGRPAGLALTALWYLGKSGVSSAVIEKIKRKLPPGAFEELNAAVTVMPAWMTEALARHQTASTSANSRA